MIYLILTCFLLLIIAVYFSTRRYQRIKLLSEATEASLIKIPELKVDEIKKMHYLKKV